jgi:Helix-turn-helix domain
MATITSIKPRSNTYLIDNILVDEYAEKIGAIGIAIYNVLSRYADRKTGVCFPCIGTIAKKLKLGRTTVKKYLKILYKVDLITILHRTSPDGDPTSNSYMLLDPSPEKIALRRRQLEALLIPQQGTFRLDPVEGSQDGGRSSDDPPPCLNATDPQSPADPEQSSLLNKNTRTSLVALLPTEKQKTCAHPPSEIVYLADNVTICHHCYGLLDDNLKLRNAEATVPADIVAA